MCLKIEMTKIFLQKTEEPASQRQRDRQKEKERERERIECEFKRKI